MSILNDPTYVRRYTTNGNNHLDLQTHSWDESALPQTPIPSSISISSCLSICSSWSYTSLRASQNFRVSKYFVSLGDVEFKRGNFLKSLNYYERGVSIVHSVAGGWRGVGQSMENLGRGGEGVTILGRACREWDDNDNNIENDNINDNVNVNVNEEEKNRVETLVVEIEVREREREADKERRRRGRGTQKILIDARMEQAVVNVGRGGWGMGERDDELEDMVGSSMSVDYPMLSYPMPMENENNDEGGIIVKEKKSTKKKKKKKKEKKEKKQRKKKKRRKLNKRDTVCSGSGSGSDSDSSSSSNNVS